MDAPGTLLRSKQLEDLDSKCAALQVAVEGLGGEMAKQSAAVGGMQSNCVQLLQVGACPPACMTACAFSSSDCMALHSHQYVLGPLHVQVLVDRTEALEGFIRALHSKPDRHGARSPCS